MTRAKYLDNWEPSSAMLEMRNLAAGAWQLRGEDITGRCKLAEYALARHAAAWALRKGWPEISLPQIGKILGGRDHTTVLHSVKVADDLRQRDMVFHAVTEALMAKRKTGLPPPLFSMRPERTYRWCVPEAVVTAYEERVRRWRAEEKAEWERLCSPERSPTICSLNGVSVISRAELNARRGEGERARKEREAYWLEREQARYGLRRPALPLSAMAL